MIRRCLYSFVGIFLAAMLLMGCKDEEFEPQIPHYLVGSTYVAPSGAGTAANPYAQAYLAVEFLTPDLFSVVSLNATGLPIQTVGIFRYRAEHRNQQVTFYYWPGRIPHEPSTYDGQMLLDLNGGNLSYQGLTMVRRP